MPVRSRASSEHELDRNIETGINGVVDERDVANKFAEFL